MDNLTNQQINQGLYRRLQAGSLYAPYMPASDCSSKLLGRGDTSFAITNMAATARKYQHHTKLLTLRFFSSYKSLYSLCSALHQFLFWHFQYAIDGDAQMLRSPACSWASRHSGIDCKSYSIFGSTVLLNLGIKHYMRRIVQPSHPDGYTHVYLVIPKNQKTASLNSGYYVIDGTINTEKELPYLKHDDILMSSSANQITGTSLAAPATPDLTDDVGAELSGLLNQSYQVSKDISQTSEAYLKQEKINKVNAIGGAASALATAVLAVGVKTAVISNAVPGIGTIIGLCIAAVTAVVALAIMLWGNPCKGAFYTSDFINENLKTGFYEPFKNAMESVRNKLAQGLETVAISDLNSIIREIDLGIAHYRHECQVHNQKCSTDTLQSYSDFVDEIKAAVDNMVKMLVAKLSENFEVQIINKPAPTSQRSWYFIVPAAKDVTTATYRYIQVSSKQSLQGVYPYDAPVPFTQWLNSTAQTIQVKYGLPAANAYRSEMQTFESRITAIRQNVWLPVDVRVLQEEPLRKLQHQLYQKYDQEYRQQLVEREKAQLEAYRQANTDFWKGLKELRAQRLNDERNSHENLRKIATQEANKRLGLEDKKLLNLALLGALGIGIIYSMKN